MTAEMHDEGDVGGDEDGRTQDGYQPADPK
jgi:hypothetical protein